MNQRYILLRSFEAQLWRVERERVREREKEKEIIIKRDKANEKKVLRAKHFFKYDKKDK